MRFSSLFCIAAFCLVGAHAQAAGIEAAGLDQAKAKCEEQLSANQETLGQLKALGQALNNEKLSGAVAQAEGGCDQLAAQAAGSQQAGQANATLDKVKAAGDALKSLGSVFGN